MYRVSSVSIMIFCLLSYCLITGCVTSQGGGKPKSFSRSAATGWTSIEIRKELDFDRTWNTVVNLLVRDFDLQFIAKDEGYILTSWLHTWSGRYQVNYRVRVTVKFSDDRKKLQVKSEAQYLVGLNWIVGMDSRLVSTLKTDLMGVLSRTTR